ncbi:DEAD/DEAH box helicase [Enterobacter hormaechei]|uniref:DEAD/DEAH box helicase n=1 Tax=Enterobacter hormaechei TaxID=158836 RepID=UPI003CF521A5
MKINEFPLMSKDILLLETDKGTTGFRPKQAITFQAYGENWLAVQGDHCVSVQCSPGDHELFSRLVMRDQVRWLLTSKAEKQLRVQYCTPVEVTPMQLELGIDERIAEDLFAKKQINNNDIELACRWFEETFIVHSESESDWLTVGRFSNHAAKGGFQLLGNGWRADVERNPDHGFLIRRITGHLSHDTGFSLLVGHFAFRDMSVAAVLNSATQQAMLDAALRDSASYLELWNLYNDKEWQSELKKAETLGVLRFVACEGTEAGRENVWHLTPRTPEEYREFRQRWRALDLPAGTQVDLGAETPDWAEELSTEEDTVLKTPRGKIEFADEYVVFTSASNRRDVRPAKPEGWLYLSLAGYRTVGKRRLAAKRAIDSGKRMPQLKWLLEGVVVPAARRRNIQGMTPYAREIFKGGKPTGNQELAVFTALNTPDIAIVIGPPGTGKTQVIAALQRRLAEEAQEKNIAAQVLISSFQHDAVDNALDRSDVFGLPASRVGGRRASVEDESPLDPWLSRHASHLQEKIADQYQRYPELKTIADLTSRLALQRLANDLPQQRAEAFSHIYQDVNSLAEKGLVTDSRLEIRLQDYIKHLKQDGVAEVSTVMNVAVLRRIRALRTTQTAFSDDGADRAWDLLRWLKRNVPDIDAELTSVLEIAADAREVPVALVECQQQLLERFLPDYRPPALKNKIDDEGLALLNDLDKHLSDLMHRRKQGVAWVLEQMSDTLEMDRRAAQEVVDEYAMVVGATCQQAAGQQMASLKSVSGVKSSDIEFDTVVVDEAARANPLDLFVPMSMATRRIILVGDDRQLPHMLEPDIEGQLQEEHQLTALQLAAFRSSLFERMRLKLLDLQKKDNLQRVVMLDKQFRMHPLLGDFISQQFYEKEGLGRVEPGRSAEEFVFDEGFLRALGPLASAYRDKVCQWIDLPASAGLAEKSGTSRIRTIEAERIAQEVAQLLKAGGETLSVGVITFYAAQRELIMEKLSEIRLEGVPLMEKRNGTYEPHENFRWVRKYRADGSFSQEERLRVGSVDAFQGKEFDVVLLSCVRTWRQPRSSSAADDAAAREQMLNELFGFLRLPNRMNVAMSRQRQMLLCFGDAALATAPEALEAAPALAAFHTLCGGVHGTLR